MQSLILDQGFRKPSIKKKPYVEVLGGAGQLTGLEFYLNVSDSPEAKFPFLFGFDWDLD